MGQTRRVTMMHQVQCIHNLQLDLPYYARTSPIIMPGNPRALCPVRLGVIPRIRAGPYARYHTQLILVHLPKKLPRVVLVVTVEYLKLILYGPV